jgi:transposase-like protein
MFDDKDTSEENDAWEEDDVWEEIEEEDDDEDGEGGEKKKKPKRKKKESKSGITRIRYSNDFKVKVLDELEVSNVTIAEMARRHKLPEATLRDWVKTKAKITTAQVNRRGSAKSNSRDNLQKVTDALRTFMDLNDRLGACGMSKLPITNAMIAKQGQEVKALLLEKDAKKPFLTAQERKTLNVRTRNLWNYWEEIKITIIDSPL